MNVSGNQNFAVCSDAPKFIWVEYFLTGERIAEQERRGMSAQQFCEEENVKRLCFSYVFCSS
jgi:hypothetical protein